MKVSMKTRMNTSGLRFVVMIALAVCLVSFALEWLAVPSPVLAGAGTEPLPAVAEPVSGLQSAAAFVVTGLVALLAAAMAVFPMLVDESSRGEKHRQEHQGVD